MKKSAYLKELYKEWKMLRSELENAVYLGHLRKAGFIANRIELLKEQIKEEEN